MKDTMVVNIENSPFDITTMANLSAGLSFGASFTLSCTANDTYQMTSDCDACKEQLRNPFSSLCRGCKDKIKSKLLFKYRFADMDFYSKHEDESDAVREWKMQNEPFPIDPYTMEYNTDTYTMEYNTTAASATVGGFFGGTTTGTSTTAGIMNGTTVDTRTQVVKAKTEEHSWFSPY